MDEIIFVQTFSLLCKFVSTNTDRTNAIAQETNGIALETKNEGTDKRLRMLRLITVRFIWV